MQLGLWPEHGRPAEHGRSARPPRRYAAGVMVCSNCAGPVPETAHFCPQCGSSVQASCSACGAALVPGARFCAQCGTGVAATPTTSTPTTSAKQTPADDRGPGPASERKLVSVLFADLVGFTTLAEGRDHEDVRELLSRYFEQCQEVIGRYGGTVEKFIGDAVMAVWGAPITRENDAERAVRAALDLVDAVRVLGPGIQARAAVVTGEAAVTIGATNQGLVAGDIVNTASRLQGVAAPGTVLVGEATEQAARSAIAFEPMEGQVLKGKSDPVPAFRAIRVIAERGGRGRTEGLEAPFIGREAEFRLLRELVHAAGRDGRARLVSITGVAGVGKSRMARELSNYLDGLVVPIYWHAGRSPAYGEGVTFWALGEMVRGRIGTAEGDDEAATRAALGQAISRWIPDEQERRWVERALLVLLGFEVATGLAREELFSAWRTFFERIAADGTVLLVFEDLHWADAGLLDFIDDVLDWSKGAPLVLVTLARPELFERRPDWGAGRRSFVGLALEPLPETVIGQILDALAPGLPDAAAAAIIGRADGIPLYAVETVRMLVAEGRLVAEDGRYRPTGDLGALAVPATLQALIAARLDALEPDERAFICDAAVLGQSFTPAGLAAVSGLDAAAVDRRLRSLVRRELLVQDVDPRSPERGHYAFEQALVREVAYGTLARRDRRARHLAAARFFESLGEDELAGALASHYLAAYRASTDDPDEAQALAAQARLALRGAAERAATLGSNDQAATFFLEALEVTTEPADRAGLLESAGVAADYASRSGEAEEHLRAAIQAWRQLGDRLGAARATGLLGRAVVNGWRATDAQSILEPANAEFADLGDDPGLALIEHQLARAYWFQEELDKAIPFADRALGRAERLDDLAIVADTLITKGAMIAVNGRPYEGFGAMEAGRALAEQQGLSGIVARAMLNMAGGHMGRDPRRALDISREAMALARRIGFRSFLATAAGNGLEVAVELGQLDWAIETGDELLSLDLEANDRRSLIRGIEEARMLRALPVDDLLAEHAGALDAPTPDIQEVANYRAVLALRAFLGGRFAEAADLWERVATESSINAVTSLPQAARAALWADDRPTFERLLDDLAAKWVHGPASHARYTALAAAREALAGQRDEAIAGYARAFTGLRELGLEVALVLAILDMVRVLGSEDPAVRASIDEARTIIDRIDIPPLAERLRVLVAGGDHAPGTAALAALAAGAAGAEVRSPESAVGATEIGST